MLTPDTHTPRHTLRHSATHWDTLQNTAMQCNVRHAPAQTHCNTLQDTATHCTTLQRTATHCNALQHPTYTRLDMHTCTNVNKHKPLLAWHTLVRVCNNTLQHAAIHCNALQHPTHIHQLAQTQIAILFDQRLQIAMVVAFGVSFRVYQWTFTGIYKNDSSRVRDFRWLIYWYINDSSRVRNLRWLMYCFWSTVVLEFSDVGFRGWFTELV